MSTSDAGRLVAGRYRLESRLGIGGMGDVWRATDERLDRAVAVKLLRRDQADPSARDRFAAEGRAVARIRHPNVVEIYDAGQDDGRSYLVMACLPGHTLKDRLAEGPLSDAEARQAVVQVLAGLGAAHQAGLVHRDVKPSNVLLADDGRWCVADFGIAKPLVPSSDDADLTRTGQVYGTPAYTAPERLAGQPATVASDLWSVGALLHEAVADRYDVDPELAAVADRALRRNPAERFATATSMAAALGADDAPIPAGAGAPEDATVAAAPHTQLLAVDDPSPTWPTGRRVAVAVIALLVVVTGSALARGGGGDADRPPAGASTSSTTAAEPTTTAAPSTTLITTTTASPTTPTPTTPPTTAAEPDPGKPEKPGKPDKPNKPEKPDKPKG